MLSDLKLVYEDNKIDYLNQHLQFASSDGDGPWMRTTEATQIPNRTHQTRAIREIL